MLAKLSGESRERIEPSIEDLPDTVCEVLRRAPSTRRPVIAKPNQDPATECVRERRNGLGGLVSVPVEARLELDEERLVLLPHLPDVVGGDVAEGKVPHQPSVRVGSAADALKKDASAILLRRQGIRSVTVGLSSEPDRRALPSAPCRRCRKPTYC